MLRELQGKRRLVAAPETAERLRSAYDLDVLTSATLTEGQLYVIDDEAIGKSLAGPHVVHPVDAPMPWFPPLKASGMINISGV